MTTEKMKLSMVSACIIFMMGTALLLLSVLSGQFLLEYLLIIALSYGGTIILVVNAFLKFRPSVEVAAPSSTVRIVAIDDEADILRLIRIKLTKEGFKVSTSSDGEEGVKKVVAERPDIMIVDVMMPGKDGYQVVSEVKRILKEKAPVVIMLTSKAEEADMVKGFEAGADDYIAKPFSPRELIERINVALIKEKRSATSEK
jgi:CheY-like chemotaxis protein